MTNELNGDGNELSTDMSLSDDINTITAEINAYQRVAGEAIFEIGRRLKHVKENDLAHGEFGKWHEEELGIDRRVASKFMQIVTELGESNVATFRHLGMTALYEIATLPPAERNQTHTTSKGEEKKPEDMTVKELREVKRQLKAEKEAKEQAEYKAEEAEARASQYRKSSEIERKKREEAEEREPEVRYETRTEYIEVKDEEIERRLKAYEDRFGAIENYSERARATNLDEVTTSVMTFTKAVRDLTKRHAYLIKYQGTVASLDPITKKEYNEAVEALTDLAKDFNEVSETETIIIDQK